MNCFATLSTVASLCVLHIWDVISRSEIYKFSYRSLRIVTIFFHDEQWPTLRCPSVAFAEDWCGVSLGGVMGALGLGVSATPHRVSLCAFYPHANHAPLNYYNYSNKLITPLQRNFKTAIIEFNRRLYIWKRMPEKTEQEANINDRTPGMKIICNYL